MTDESAEPHQRISRGHDDRRRYDLNPRLLGHWQETIKKLIEQRRSTGVADDLHRDAVQRVIRNDLT